MTTLILATGLLYLRMFANWYFDGYGWLMFTILAGLAAPSLSWKGIRFVTIAWLIFGLFLAYIRHLK